MYDTAGRRRLIEVAAGRVPADLVLKNAVYFNVFTATYEQGDLALCDGIIAGIGQYSGLREISVPGLRVLPGFIDAHIHLESALVAPSAFAAAVLPHGTTTVVTDPHEIANVLGADGIRYMLEATEGLPLDVRFMLPSCVPATPWDEAGAVLEADDLTPLLAHPRVIGLAELMNFVGTVQGDEAVLQKLELVAAHGRRVDGHAPGLSGAALNAYIAAGVHSDHECTTLAEAREKLRRGQFIMLRDGTAAHNLQALWPLLCGPGSERCLLCTDDKHPSDLLEKGHMDYLLRTALALGSDEARTIQAATYNAAQYFGLHDRGAIAPGRRADLVLVDDTSHVQQVYRDGVLRYEASTGIAAFTPPCVSPTLSARAHDTMHCAPLTAADFTDEAPRPVIGLVPGELITESPGDASAIDPARDILRLAVVERRHRTGHIGLCYLHGYGLRRGAVATSVAHDSHNLIVAGASAKAMALAAERVRLMGGGIVVADENDILAEVPLSIAGLMSDAPLPEVNQALEAAKAAARALGCQAGIDPFMTLSFLSLPVIPTLRLTTRGAFDVNTQTLYDAQG